MGNGFVTARSPRDMYWLLSAALHVRACVCVCVLVCMPVYFSPWTVMARWSLEEAGGMKVRPQRRGVVLATGSLAFTPGTAGQGRSFPSVRAGGLCSHCTPRFLLTTFPHQAPEHLRSR